MDFWELQSIILIGDSKNIWEKCHDEDENESRDKPDLTGAYAGGQYGALRPVAQAFDGG